MVGPLNNSRRRIGTRTVFLAIVVNFDRKYNCYPRDQRNSCTMYDTLYSDRFRNTRTCRNGHAAQGHTDSPRLGSNLRRNSCKSSWHRWHNQVDRTCILVVFYQRYIQLGRMLDMFLGYVHMTWLTLRSFCLLFWYKIEGSRLCLLGS